MRQRGEAFPSAELVAAAAKGEVPRLRALLDAGADPDSTDGSLTALQRACAERQPEAADVLLTAGASVSLISPGRATNGMAALHFAARAGPRRLVAMLLESAADPAQAGTDGMLPLDRVSFLTRDMVGVQRLLRTRMRERTTLEGWLIKLGSERKTWRRRYCVLLPDQLRYYSDEAMSDLRGRVELRETPEHPTSPSAYPNAPTRFSFELGSTQRTFVFCARGAAELAEWLHHLRAQIARARLDPGPGAMLYAADWQAASSPKARRELSEMAFSELSASPTSSKSSPRLLGPRQASRPALSASEAELQKSGALTLELGDDEYEPLTDVQMRPLGSSLLLLSRAPRFSPLAPLTRRRDDATAPALGVVCEVKLVRGHRMLTVKSSVEVVNDMAVPLLLSMAGAGRRGGGETLRVPPHESLPLPLRWTERGSDAACLELALRPEASHQWSHLVTLTAETALLTCAPAHAASTAAARGGSVKGGASDATAPWMCCAQLELRPHARHGAQATFSRRQLKQLRRFDLPPSEPLLHCYGAVLSVKGSSVTAPCSLYLTPGFLCFHATLGGVAEALRWDEVEQIHASSARSIEVLLTSRRHLSFSGLLNRDATFGHMRAVRLQARQEWASGLTRWRPRRLRLQAPLSLHNLLPCALHLSVSEQASADEADKGPEKPSTSSSRSGSRLDRVVAPAERRATDADDERAAALPRAPELEATLEAGASRDLHALHILTPLRLRLWLGAEAYDDAPLRGSLTFERPAGESKQRLACVLRNNPDAAGGAAARAVALRVSLVATAAATYGVSVSAPHWLHNYSSLPLQLHEAKGHAPSVLRCAPYARQPQLFSLASDHGSARLGLAELAPRAVPSPPKEGAATAEEAAAPPPRPPLSPPFSVEAVGNYGALELRGADGSVCELAMQITASQGPLRAAGATVITLHDRFILRNRSGIELEWAQAGDLASISRQSRLTFARRPLTRADTPLIPRAGRVRSHRRARDAAAAV